MFKKCVSVLCVALIAAASFVLPVHAQEGSVSVSAQAAVVINADNGQVLYAKNAENQQANGKHHKNYDGAFDLRRGCERE